MKDFERLTNKTNPNAGRLASQVNKPLKAAPEERTPEPLRVRYRHSSFDCSDHSIVYSYVLVGLRNEEAVLTVEKDIYLIGHAHALLILSINPCTFYVETPIYLNAGISSLDAVEYTKFSR